MHRWHKLLLSTAHESLKLHALLPYYTTIVHTHMKHSNSIHVFLSVSLDVPVALFAAIAESSSRVMSVVVFSSPRHLDTHVRESSEGSPSTTNPKPMGESPAQACTCTCPNITGTYYYA